MKRHFWAKTTGDDQQGISVLEHMIDVGSVARALAAGREEQLRLFKLTPALVGALAALHDLGKISPGFQRKCEEWLREHDLFDVARCWNWEQVMEADHGKTTHAALQSYFRVNNVDAETATFLSCVLGAHHGRLHPPDDRGFRPTRAIVEGRSGIDWDKERQEAAREVFSRFGVDPLEVSIDASSPALWWLAGLTSVADWVGSDEKTFPATRGEHVERAPEGIERCLEEIGVVPPRITRGRSFYDLFDLNPNEMQTAALSAITDRGVYVIEAPMGTGKTEAALGAAYQLLAAGKATGIYFALPSQATSDRMHLRMAEFVRRIAPGGAATRVIHGNSWLMDGQIALSPGRTAGAEGEDAEVGRDWFSSAKRALIAPFGVGTIDQALLGVVAAKHFFVRHFALAGKVVILDEIHSYDLYTGTLIDLLIQALERLGCTVIVLSATLSKARRAQIIATVKPRGIPARREPYPLVTGRRNGKAFRPLAVAPPKPNTIAVDFKSEEHAISMAVDAATRGASVVWVCDTVDSAQQVYVQLRTRNDGGYPIGLLHARFPFWRRKELENEWMNRLGKGSSTRCGSMLVSTQIVEQSVDLDADLMFTELAPTDMLLQRMGRLWRHERKQRPLSVPQLVIIREMYELERFRAMQAQEIKVALGTKAWVYDPYVLLRSLREWERLKKLTIPNDVRRMIELTYRELQREPEGWRRLSDEAEGKKIALRQKALMSGNVWQTALLDEAGVQTRINDVPELSLVLCSSISDDSIEFVDGTCSSLQGGGFDLSTAQAIHRNIVRISGRHFDANDTHPSITRHVLGRYTIVFVQGDGIVSAQGLKAATRLRWDLNLGLVIQKRILSEGL